MIVVIRQSEIAPLGSTRSFGVYTHVFTSICTHVYTHIHANVRTHMSMRMSILMATRKYMPHVLAKACTHIYANVPMHMSTQMSALYMRMPHACQRICYKCPPCMPMHIPTHVYAHQQDQIRTILRILESSRVLVVPGLVHMLVLQLFHHKALCLSVLKKCV